MTFWSDPITFLAEWLKGVLLGWGITAEVTQLILFILGAAILAAGSMVFVIFLIWLERKLLGRIQDRLGPNRLGPWGIIQPIADMLKIFTKEYITPAGADVVPYNLGPILTVGAVVGLMGVVPLAITVVGADLDVGVLYLVAIGGIGELGIILSGWGSNNKYAMLGAFRAVAQLLSYEVPLVVSLLVPVMLTGSLNLNDIVKAQSVWFIIIAPVPAFIYLISSIAENGRSPFDLLEAESEIVSGFNVEYSGLKFGMFYVADFLHSFVIGLLFATLFLGGWRGPGAEQYPILGFFYLVVKAAFPYFFILLLRGSLPRFRIDQMMNLNWKVLTPVSLAAVMVIALTDKLIPAGQPLWLRIAALIAANVLVWLGAQFLLKRSRKRRVRRVVATGQRPVARPDSTSTLS